MKNDRLKTVAIIPAWNEESSIAKVILRAKQHVDNVIVCDDGSTDMTPLIAEALGAKVIRHAERRGKGEALRTLSKEAMELGADIIVALDGDGQHDPDGIPSLVKPIEAGESEVVIGSRYVDGGNMDAPWYRRFGLWALNFLYRKATGLPVKDTQSGFRAYSQKAFGLLIQYDANGYGVEGEQLMLAAKNGFKVIEVPISAKYRNLKTTSKKPALLQGADLISTLLRIVVEERPLKYLGLPGIGLTCLGAMLGLYLLWMFNMTRYFSIPIALLVTVMLALGMVLVVFAITLHGLKRVSEKLNRFNESAHYNSK